MAGLLEEAPKVNTVDLEQGLNKRIDEFADKGMESTQTIAEGMNQGIDNARGLIDDSNNQFAQSESALGMNPATTQAIQNKYKVRLGNELERIRSKNLYDAEAVKADRLAKIQGVLGARQQVKNEAYQRKMMAHKARQQARSSFLSSILSLGGTIVGTALAGPVGGVAGAEVGKKVGGNNG